MDADGQFSDSKLYMSLHTWRREIWGFFGNVLKKSRFTIPQVGLTLGEGAFGVVSDTWHRYWSCSPGGGNP